MFYNLTHTLAVNVDQVSPGPVEVTDFLFWLVIFFGLVLSLKLQIELSGIHWSGKVSYLPMCHCLVIPSKNQPTNPSQVPCTHPNKYTHTHIYIYIYIYIWKTWPRFAPACVPLVRHRHCRDDSNRNSLHSVLHENYCIYIFQLGIFKWHIDQKEGKYESEY